MFILEVDESDSKKVQVNLPHEGLEVDSRVIYYDRNNYRFDCQIEGNILTITRIDNAGGNGWNVTLKFRVYDPSNETVPNVNHFNKHIYTYHGLEGEQAPCDTVKIIVHSSVTVIRERAFIGCRQLKSCIMSDNIERIERSAFEGCEVMEHLYLSRGLSYIGPRAFLQCQSMDVIFLPNSLEQIGQCAFQSCTNMRILVLPQDMELSNVGERIVLGCRELARGMRDHRHRVVLPGDTTRYDQVHYWLKHRLDNLPFLKLCMDPSINVQRIQHYLQQNVGIVTDTHESTETNNDAAETQAHVVQKLEPYGLTPLHILAMNPHATTSTIVACCNAYPSATICHDEKGCTPLDYMWKYGKFDGIIGTILQVLCIQRNNLTRCIDRKRKRIASNTE